jgi:hypothetical protein
VKFKLYIFLLIIACFASCDILRFSPFEVTSWTPGGGYHSEPEKITVSLVFSHEPDRASVERNFSLTGNENRVRGTFLWEGRTLVFSFLTPPEKNTDYVITISADAHDTEGLSMDKAFNGEFTTRESETRPALVSCFPSMYADISDPAMEVKLEFSIPVPLNAIYDYISFTPSMQGLWRLENEEKLAIFTPAEPWTQNSRYEIRFSTSLTDNNGMNIGNDFVSVFTTGIDREKPYLLYAQRITKDGEVIQLKADRGYSGAGEFPIENDSWEKDDRLSLVFSKQVDSVSVKNYLSADDAPALVMETYPGYKTEFIFRFDGIPAYESRFTFRIKAGVKDLNGNETKDEYVYRIFADGKFSKPPEFVGFRMPLTPGSENNLVCLGTDSSLEKVAISEENYPSGDHVQTWFDLYFSAAEGADIDLFSLMDLFRIETSNNVFSFSPDQIKTRGFSISDPQTDWENFIRIEIAGQLVNTTNYGIVYFQIAAGLKDSLGNKNENSQKIIFIK